MTTRFFCKALACHGLNLFSVSSPCVPTTPPSHAKWHSWGVLKSFYLLSLLEKHYCHECQSMSASGREVALMGIVRALHACHMALMKQEQQFQGLSPMRAKRANV